MNEAFVNIKVDREERPDVDGVYMRAVQALTGRGGWPLTAFLTPEGTPFYGGTYFPPEPRHGMPAFRQVLLAVADAWQNRRDEVLGNARELTAALEHGTRRADPGSGTFRQGEVPGPSLVEVALRHLSSRFDRSYGGFGEAPKFPQPVTLEFLLSAGLWQSDPQAVEMAVHTLRAMAAGGIRDHLAGGFHRYSVDDRWLVPHFEKMLYDNGLLARLYLDAWRVTGDDDLRAVCQETLDYLLGDLRDPAGGFYAARDADSEGEEGLFYLWTPDQVREAARDCDPGAVDIFMRLHDVSAEGNFEGRSILHLPHPVESVARSEGLSPGELRSRIAPVAEALRGYRDRREAPFRDEKVLTAWSAFTVRALAEAGAALGRADYLDAAVAGGRFLVDVMVRDEGLLRAWKAGDVRIPAFLEDWAALGNACLSLHAATLDPAWLHRAAWAGDEILNRFLDADDGLLYDTPDHPEGLPLRPRELMDNATPSGNSLAVELFLRGGALLSRPAWTEAATAILAREAGAMERFPSAFGRLLTQVVRYHAEPVEVAIIGDPAQSGTTGLLRAAHRSLHPAMVLAGGDPADPDFPRDLPLFAGREGRPGEPAAWVCRRFACQAPVTDPADLRGALSEMDGPFHSAG
jgi:uncharacterized protein YyaL (SSP411 family)